MEWDGEIFVEKSRTTARCLIGECRWEFRYHGGVLRGVVQDVRDALTEHRYLHHKERKQRAQVELRFADGITV